MEILAKILIFCSLSALCVFVVTQSVCTNSPPSGKDITECCGGLPNVFDIRLNETCIWKYAKNTQKQLQDLSPGDAPKGNCVLECIANQTKIYKGRGAIDVIQLKRIFMNSVSGDRQWGNIVARAVDLCVNETRIMHPEMKTNMRQSKTSFSGEIICHPVSGYVFGCLQTELFRKCPNMTESKECESLQEYAAECHIGVKYD